MGTIEISSRQEDVLNEWDSTDNNILISSVAGSGKTTTLMLLLEKCNHRTLILAFNRSIQKEIQDKIDSKGMTQGKSMTMHSMGLKSIKNAGLNIRVESGKNWNLIKILQKEYKSKVRNIPYDDRSKIMYSLTEINDVSRMYLTDDLEVIKKYMRSMDKIVPESDHLLDLWELLIEIRDEGYNKNVIEIDFIDMIYLPVRMELTIPIYPYYIFIDEAQDLNLAQHKLFDKLIKENNVRKWIAVGDENQSIYGFAGATSDSFDRFRHKESVVELPLDICYRCSSNIIDKANEVYPVMAYGKTEEGIVKTITSIDTIEDNSLIICRNSNPLISLYFKLLSQGRSCYINGSEMMYFLIRFLKEYSKHTVRSARIEMEYKMSDLLEDETDKGKFKYYIFQENYENFMVIATNMFTNMDKIEDVIDKLKDLFKTKPHSIMLCTIHKSKGLEADTVYILNENLIPSKFAKSPEQIRQENNLKYVARTRAKNKLYFLNLKKEKL